MSASNKRRASIFSKGRTLDRFKERTKNAKVEEQKAQTLDKTPETNFKKDVEDYLENFGGGYNPDFGFQPQFDFQKRNKWVSILDYISGESKDEKVSSVIKTMKGRKEIEKMIKESKNTDMLTENENILKSYILEKSVLPKLKRDSKVQNMSRGSIFRIDTVSAMNNLIHQKTFLNEIKKTKSGKKQKFGRNRIAPMSPPSGTSKKVTFSEMDQDSF